MARAMPLLGDEEKIDMARDDKSQIGAKEGIARDVDGVGGVPKGDETYRSTVGLETVEQLDSEDAHAQARSDAAVAEDRAGLDLGDRDERIDTRTEATASASDSELDDTEDQLSAEDDEGDEGSARGLRSSDPPDSSRADSPPTSRARPDAPRSSGARGGSGGGRNRPTDEGANAGSGRAGSQRAVKDATRHQMNATVRGAASSGEQRGATLGPRPATRLAANETRGTAKPGIRRGSSKSRSARRSQAHH